MEIKRTDLSSALQSAARVLEKRSKIPLLSQFRLDLQADALVIDATDLDQSVQLRMDANGGTPQTICVDGRSLTNILARLTEDTIVFDVVKNDLVIKRKAGNIKLRTADANKFPAFPVGEANKVGFKANEFAQVCTSALLGTAEDHLGTFAFKNVAELTVEKNLIEGKFRCVTTDQQRIAVMRGLCEAEESITLQVPIQALKTLGGLKNTEDVWLGEDTNHIFARVGANNFVFRKIAANFPKFDTYLDTVNFDRVVAVDTARLKQSLELVNQVIDPRSGGFTISLNGELKLSAAGSEGEIEDIIETQVDFDAFETRYNISYVLPLIRQMQGEIELQFALGPHGNYPLRVVSNTNNVISSFDIQSRHF